MALFLNDLKKVKLEPASSLGGITSYGYTHRSPLVKREWFLDWGEPGTLLGVHRVAEVLVEPVKVGHFSSESSPVVHVGGQFPLLLLLLLLSVAPTAGGRDCTGTMEILWTGVILKKLDAILLS